MIEAVIEPVIISFLEIRGFLLVYWLRLLKCGLSRPFGKDIQRSDIYHGEACTQLRGINGILKQITNTFTGRGICALLFALSMIPSCAF